MAIMKIEVTKAKQALEINTKALPDEVYNEVVRQGLKVLLNRGMTKITKETYPNAEELKAAALEKAQTTLEDMKAGKIRIMGAKGDRVSGVVMTEARRIAKALVKDEMKRQKIKVSYVEASEITKAANALIAANPAIVEQAKANIEAREKEAQALKEGLAQIVTPGMVSAAKAAKVDKAKAEAKEKMGTLSATQAGQIAQRPAPKASKPGKAASQATT